MARIAFGATLNGDLGQGRFNTSAGSVAPATTSAAIANGTLRTDVAAAVATLVADGASPTQAHVTTLNNAWGLLNTAIGNAATAAAAANVVLDVDTGVVTTQNGIMAALRELMQTVKGSGLPS